MTPEPGPARQPAAPAGDAGERGTWRCRLAGHRFRFVSTGQVMEWRCQRGCGAGGTKVYDTEADAARFAEAFDREDGDELGRRAPFLGLLPLRIWYRLRHR